MMGRPVGVSVVIVLLVGALPAAAGAPADESVANEPPLVDAGLDQQVQYGATVRLDATASRDPDGEITGYEWSIRRPDGTTTAPACESCGQTSFQPVSVGTYEVTVTGTDDDGTARSDTLYVAVEAGQGPSVSLNGPTAPTVGYQSFYIASVSAGDQPLDRIAWFVGGNQANSTSVTAGNATGGFRFESTSRTQVSVRVTDEAGQTAWSNLTVEPEAAMTASVRSGSTGGGDRGPPDGQYSSGLDIWIEGDGADSYKEAVWMATGKSRKLGPRDRGGLNDNDEPWDNGNGDVNMDITGHPDKNDGSEDTNDKENGRNGKGGGLGSIGESISDTVNNII